MTQTTTALGTNKINKQPSKKKKKTEEKLIASTQLFITKMTKILQDAGVKIILLDLNLNLRAEKITAVDLI